MNERIKELRKLLNLTQREFANKIGMQTNTIAVYEMGVRKPKSSTISIICHEFNVNEEWLLNGIGDTFISPEQSNAIPSTINKRVTEVRLSFRLNMTKFGERLGVGKTAISCVENGKHTVSNQLFRSICREFNVNEEWLRTGEGKMFKEYDDVAIVNVKERLIGAITVMSDDDALKLWNYLKKEVL